MSTANEPENVEKPNMIILHLENNRKAEHLADSVDGAQRKKYSWSSVEQEALLKGVYKYGEGKWQQILDSSDVFHPVRSAVDLKDKFRLLNKASSYYRLSKQHWYEVLDDNTVRLDAVEKPKSMFTRFPHDATKLFAFLRNKDDERSFILRLAKKETRGTQRIHVYKVAWTDKGWKVMKQAMIYSKKVIFMDE